MFRIRIYGVVIKKEGKRVERRRGWFSYIIEYGQGDRKLEVLSFNVGQVIYQLRVQDFQGEMWFVFQGYCEYEMRQCI